MVTTRNVPSSPPPGDTLDETPPNGPSDNISHETEERPDDAGNVDQQE